ncbi:MAG: hypothetical protein II458_08670 [Oscillospiraceae bacterium]|nr:hypothetical protein [Oscillospiraceae bacterium]
MLAPDTVIDLHVRTTVSDGTDTPGCGVSSAPSAWNDEAILSNPKGQMSGAICPFSLSQ